MSHYHTIMTSGYTTQSGDDARATGGVTFAELSRGARGILLRHTDGNGVYRSSGRPKQVSDTVARELIARAVSRGATNGGLTEAEARAVAGKLRLADAR